MAAFIDFLMKQKAELPKLPVPKLHKTVQLYIKSVKPFLAENELKVTEHLADEFVSKGGVGETLQKLLEKKAATCDNWLSDWWINVAYLDIRLPLPVYSNTNLVFPEQKFLNKLDQLSHAAALISGVLDFKHALYSNKIAPEQMGRISLDMSQFANLYCVSRIPGQTRDTVQLTDITALTQYITVVHNNHFFVVPVYDENEKVLNQRQIISQLEKVITQSTSTATSPVGILTTENRTTWCKAREALLKDEQNRKSLGMIERGLFMVCLDGSSTEIGHNNKSTNQSMNASALKMMHGGGINAYSANRWFDQVSQFIVSETGEVGLSYEHSPGDSHPILTDHMQSYWTTKKGNADPVPPAGNFDVPQKLQFNVSSDVQAFILAAGKNLDSLINDIEVNCFIFSEYGKDAIKLAQLGSPDTFIQIAIQLSFYRLHNMPGAQYESAMTRKFLYGRTETIRSCSLESVHFARTMLDPTACDSDKASALQAAMIAHKDYVLQAVSGEGVDRHLLGLRLIAAENQIELPNFFFDTGFTKSGHMKLSTSQVPAINNSCGFFGPLVHDGYGCCYNPRSNEIVFGTTAFKSCTETSAVKFCEALKLSLREMKEVLVCTLLQDKL